MEYRPADEKKIHIDSLDQQIGRQHTHKKNDFQEPIPPIYVYTQSKSAQPEITIDAKLKRSFFSVVVVVDDLRVCYC